MANASEASEKGIKKSSPGEKKKGGHNKKKRKPRTGKEHTSHNKEFCPKSIRKKEKEGGQGKNTIKGTSWSCLKRRLAPGWRTSPGGKGEPLT